MSPWLPFELVGLVGFTALAVTNVRARAFAGSLLLAAGAMAVIVGLVAHDEADGWWVAAGGALAIGLGVVLVVIARHVDRESPARPRS